MVCRREGRSPDRSRTTRRRRDRPGGRSIEPGNERRRGHPLQAAMRAKTRESPSIKSKMDDVAEALVAVKRNLIGGLPKMRRTGRTDVSDLQVTVNELMPVSEPLYAVA